MRDGLDTIPAMVRRMYHHLPAAVHPAAARSVLSTVIHLVEQGVVTCGGPPSADARYAPAAYDDADLGPMP